MLIKNVNECDFVNYKQTSMFIIFPFCDFKCDKENGTQYCQNWSLIHEPNIDISCEALVERYINNPMTHAVVCGGLEPLESWDDLYNFITILRSKTNDDVVIYTGFYPEEIADKIKKLREFPNIIIKFGRFKPNYEPHYDEILGIKLASDNQYAVKIS